MELNIPLSLLAIIFHGIDSPEAQSLVVQEFERLPDVFYEHELDVTLLTVEVKGDSLVLSEPSINALAAAIVNVINGIGIFSYDSVQEFFRINNCETKAEAVLDHLHVLKSIKAVYGEELFSRRP